ncbi:MAG: sulfatase [Bacteroidia bacterium]|nr:sulfatase [Bacteroidia bacterium]
MFKPYFPYVLIPIFFFLSCSENLKEKETNKQQPNILFLIADDWSYPHAGILGDPQVKTPTFDHLAKEGALFHHAYTASPSCSPSRASILTGRYPHQNEGGGNLWSVFPGKFPTWVNGLEDAGYFCGKTRKGWAPGNFKKSGYKHNPAGQDFDSFEEFYAQKEEGSPFSFWFGSSDPHRRYEPNTGVKTGMRADLVEVPGFMPALACVQNDILDYYFEVERFDRECGQIIRFLEEKGELENTLIIMTSDNGMPFPRAKANLYDYGTRMPLAIYWDGEIKAGTVAHDFVNFVDFAPTILSAAGVDIPESFSGKNLIQPDGSIMGKDRVILERERHANVRKGDLSYPMRGLRNHEYLYIRNFMPDRWPAGDPTVHRSVGQFGDVDNSISKFLVMNLEGKEGKIDYFNLTFAKRPIEELYRVEDDPFQLNNLAADPAFAKIKQELSEELLNWMKEQGDIRASEPQSIYYDTVEYTIEYQFENYDLAEKIDAYSMLKMDARMRFVEVECLEE